MELVLGRPENTLLAQHLFHFLLERSETLWKAWHKDNPGGGLPARNSFIMSLLENFSQKLEQASRNGAKSEFGAEGGFSALILSKDKDLENFLQRRHPRLKRTRSGRRRHNPVAAQAGADAGKALNYHKPLNDGAERPATSQPLALPELHGNDPLPTRK